VEEVDRTQITSRKVKIGVKDNLVQRDLWGFSKLQKGEKCGKKVTAAHLLSLV
jgi:hypothetical protein